ncbi:MAG: PKD domain-containing protein, partial [Bacteroidota bacterium]
MTLITYKTKKLILALFFAAICIASTTNTYANLIQPPSTSQASFVVDNTCNTFPAVFSNTSDEGSINAIPDYLWDFGDGSFSNDKNPVHTYAAPGEYVVILVLIMDDGLGNVESTSYTGAVIVYPNSLSAPTAINGPAGACKNQTGIQYCVDPVPNASSYDWTIPAGVTFASATDQNCITVDFGSSYAGGDICVKANSL